LKQEMAANVVDLESEPIAFRLITVQTGLREADLVPGPRLFSTS